LPSQTRLKVRGYHLDVYGHVNNARYLEFLEEGRWQLLEEQGLFGRMEERGLSFVAVNINISYRRAAGMSEELLIETALTSIGQRSAVLRQVIRLAGTDVTVAEADVTFVLVDAKTQRAAPLEGELRERLAQLQADRPPGRVV
jgi:thioesterase-3